MADAQADGAAVSARDDLEDARRAWRSKQEAESKLAHLRRYRGMNPGMKAEEACAARELTKAWATLERVLGKAARRSHRKKGGERGC